MDDNAAGQIQADRVRQALGAAGIDLGRLWMHYFSIGGAVGELEIDAFLHHSLTLPALQRDLLAHAVNELLDHQGPARVPAASDLLDHDEPQGPDDDPPDADDEDSSDRS